MNRKKVAVIGSESFISRNFIKYCETYNKELKIEFELYDYQAESYNKKWKYQKIDFHSRKSIQLINFEVDYIFLFIGMTGTVQGFEKYEAFIKVNEIYLLNILNAYIASSSSAKIVYPSTRLIYKSSKECVKEESEIELKSIYAVTKFAAEQYLKIYNTNFKIPYVVLHICTPIGTLLDDLGNYGTFKIFEKQAREGGKITIYGDGLQRKTFTDIKDICRALCKLVEEAKTKYNIYNLGGQDLTLIEIAKYIADKEQVPIVHTAWPQIDYNVDGGSTVIDSSRFDREFQMTYRKLI